MTTKKPLPLSTDDPRVAVPLYTIAEVARYVNVPPSSLQNWVKGYVYPVIGGSGKSAPVIPSVTAPRAHPRIAFMGLAEALVIAAFRQRKIHMTKIRAALEAIKREIPVEYALANQTVYTSGPDILWDFARKTGDAEIQALVEPSTGQRVFTEAIRQYLDLIRYDEKMWADRLQLPGFEATPVVVDMKRGFGQPMLAKYRLRVVDVSDRFWYGKDQPADIAADLEIDEREVLDVIRATGRPVAA